MVFISLRLLFGLLLVFSSASLRADFDKSERFIYPSGFPTGDVLKPNEWLLVPIPWGWMAYGASERVTVGWDYPATLMGFPAGIIRWGLNDPTSDTRMAVELYAASFGGAGFDQKRNKEFTAQYRGGQGWLHFDFSHRWTPGFRTHFYLGATYSEYFAFRPNQTVDFAPTIYEGKLCPDYGIDLEWNVSNWLNIHANGVSGNTFFFVDQVLYKQVAALTFQMAPFSPHAVGILRRMRIEMSALWVKIPDAMYESSLALPLFPYVYWQF